jgi:ATP-binding cassette subfamily F protein 3
MLDIIDLVCRVAGRTLLDNTSVSIADGHRIGLIGRNGAGKSTLLKLVSHQIEPDGGEIRMPRAAKLGMVAQEAPGGAESPLEIVLAADLERAELLAEADHATDAHRISDIQTRLMDIDAHTAPARAATILAGLGFDHEAQQRPMSSYSGGWRMRVALAAALFVEPDLLLLDEPTNHLDIEAAMWLEGFLKTYPKTLLMVSHDRDFLNSVVTGILHLEGSKLVLYSGTYDIFERTRRERLAQTQAMREKQEAQRKHIQSYIDRFRAQATKARQAQSRIKALARMDPIEAAMRDESIRFKFPNPQPMPPPLIALDHASVGYEPGKPILKNLELRVDPDDRIVLLGANGNGKSTLVKLLAGRLETSAGSRTASPKMKVGYFAQHQVDELDPTETAYQQMGRRMPGAREPQIRGKLGQFGFGQERANTLVSALSGGEKARLTLCLITHDAPHLLILDEPTNHLDIEARDALIEALTDYTGAVILVSHDRHLVELVADRLWLVAGGTARPFDGDVEDYRRQVLGQTRSPDTSAPKSDKSARNAKAKKPDPELRKHFREVEARVVKLTAEKAKLETELADPKLYALPNRLAQLSRAQAEATKALEEAEARWIELAEAMEAAST